jgi:adenylate cyclase
VSSEEQDAPVATESGDGTDGAPTRHLTFPQRAALRRVVKAARKRPGEALSEDDWDAYWRFAAEPSVQFFKRLLRATPSTPRCGFCGAPFAGLGGRVLRPFGYSPSRKNPNICATCVELAPPGGMTTEVGVLFADLRGFTSDSERRSPAETSEELRRFYAHAEKVFFPEALIDKLIGDEVMALYVPPIVLARVPKADDDARRHIAGVMLRHARALLERVGYGSDEGPHFALGIGLDFGEAFIGNIGDRAVHDFTAVGDVVNTASRLQGQAAAGEVVLSARLAQWLDGAVGVPDQVELKGKAEPVEVRRVQWFPAAAPT